MKIGIMTYHGARNYGAVLQAYALQQFIFSLGQECRIIDFVSESLKDYTGLYPRRNGWKSKVKNLLMLRYHSLRKSRDIKFEDFTKKFLTLTDRHYTDENELYNLNDTIDIFVVGSDQVWNTTKAETGTAYFLGFTDEIKKRIAYAVSIGNAEMGNLRTYADLIKNFDFLSCRERRGTRIISELAGGNVKTVLDPTLLVENDVLNRLVSGQVPLHSNYIFYYSLDGFDKRRNNIEELRELGRQFGKKIIVLTPEWPKREKNFINVIDAGPIDFLNLIKNADIVCTNSFHGTALSISFKKNFYVLDKYDGFDDRKLDILRLLNLEDRMIKGLESIKRMKYTEIDYGNVRQKLNNLRQESGQYLKNAIEWLG